jgi:transcriptional regulator GlxA family with amidase domain
VKIDLPHLSELVEAFFHPIERHTSYHPFYYLSCLYELLWRIDERCASLPMKYKKLQPALTEMTECWSENPKISYYAELCRMSEASFRRLFREYMGVSPVDYRNDLRLVHAKNKLQSGEYNVSEAAEASGFSNLSFFIRLYKKKYGYTPKKE